MLKFIWSGGVSMYRCPVCLNPLMIEKTRYYCHNNHSFDVASKGYVNLLLANQKHSLNPGDSKQMILSRVNFLKLDYYAFLRKKLLETIIKYQTQEDLVFADLACGEGYYTNFLHQELKKIKNVHTIGVDISKYAIIEACKKKNDQKLTNIDYCIANLMNLPFFDESFDCLLNCFALLDVSEFYRILKDKGLFIRVLPDTYHLYELKEVLYDKVILNVMKEKNLQGFKLIDEIHISQDMDLKSSEEVYNLFTMTPYYYKSKLESLDKLQKINHLKVKASFVILVYQKEKDVTS